jgi:hypothetical protein
MYALSTHSPTPSPSGDQRMPGRFSWRCWRERPVWMPWASANDRQNHNVVCANFFACHEFTDRAAKAAWAGVTCPSLDVADSAIVDRPEDILAVPRSIYSRV